MYLHEIMQQFNLPIRVSTDICEYVLLHKPEYQLKKALDSIFYNGVYVCPTMTTALTTDKDVIFVFNNDARTFLHELGHASGYHVGRTMFSHLSAGRQQYTRRELAYEEIVAECIANLMSLELGLPGNYNDKHESYVANQLKQFSFDLHDKVITYALEDAQIAVNYIMQHWVKHEYKQSAA